MRFSIKGMLAAVGFVALGCAALLNANEVWGGLAYLAALLCICAALAGIIYLQGRRRAFWAGFAIFGWVYLLHIAVHPTSEWAIGMPSTRFVDYFHGIVAKEEQRPMREVDPFQAESLGLGPEVTTQVAIPLQADFRRIGHSLCLLLFAFAGGKLSQYFYATKDDESRNE